MMLQRVWLKVMKASVGTIGLAGLIAFGGSVTTSALSCSSTPTVSGSAPAVGYHLAAAAADGGVHNFGASGFHGSTYSDGLTGSHPLNAPIVGIQSTPDGKGYWMVGADGVVFNFGNVTFYGSTYSDGLSGLTRVHPLVSTVVGLVPTANGLAYWLATKAGFIYDFGSANFLGDSSSLGLTGLGGPTPLAVPIVGIAE